MGAGLSPEAVLVIGLIAIGVFVAGETVRGVKALERKAKCGIVRIVGKHCEPPPADPTDTP